MGPQISQTTPKFFYDYMPLHARLVMWSEIKETELISRVTPRLRRISRFDMSCAQAHWVGSNRSIELSN